MTTTPPPGAFERMLADPLEQFDPDSILLPLLLTDAPRADRCGVFPPCGILGPHEHTIYAPAAAAGRNPDAGQECAHVWVYVDTDSGIERYRCERCGAEHQQATLTGRDPGDPQ